MEYNILCAYLIYVTFSKGCGVRFAVIQHSVISFMVLLILIHFLVHNAYKLDIMPIINIKYMYFEKYFKTNFVLYKRFDIFSLSSIWTLFFANYQKNPYILKWVITDEAKYITDVLSSKQWWIVFKLTNSDSFHNWWYIMNKAILRLLKSADDFRLIDNYLKINTNSIQNSNMLGSQTIADI